MGVCRFVCMYVCTYVGPAKEFVRREGYSLKIPGQWRFVSKVTVSSVKESLVWRALNISTQ